MREKDNKHLGIMLLIFFFICLIISLTFINPIVEKNHPNYNKTELDARYGFYITNITCPNCNSTKLTPYASDIREDNHNRKIITFFYCQNCSSIFSVRPSK